MNLFWGVKIIFFFQMLKGVFLLGFIAAVATSLKLPVLDETQVRQVYVEDAEEATPPKIFIVPSIPDVYPTEVAEVDLLKHYHEDEEQPQERHIRSIDLAIETTDEGMERVKRSLQPGAPNYGVGGGGQENQNRDWGADVRKDGPNTKVVIDGKHRGGGYDVEGQWSKVVRGPGKSKPDWRIGVKW